MKSRKITVKRSLWAIFLSGTGFILSPLTWWNDLFINIPLAFGFAYVVGKTISYFTSVGLIFFLTLMSIGYFLTNVFGFMLIHKGVTTFHKSKQKISFSWRKNALYSLLAIALVYLSIKFELLDLAETEKMMATVMEVPYLR